MQITDVKIRKLYTGDRLKALVSITIDGDFAVHDLKVIEGLNRLFVAMPSCKEDSLSVYRDIAHPISQTARQQIEDAVLNAYYAAAVEQGKTKIGE